MQRNARGGAWILTDGNIDEAVHMVNDRRFGLSWTRIERVWNPDIYARENNLGKAKVGDCGTQVAYDMVV